MDVSTLKDLLNLVPTALYQDEDVLKQSFVEAHEYSFVINGSTFYDFVNKYEDTELVSFCVRKETREGGFLADTESVGEETENATSKPKMTVTKRSDGVVVNSKTYIKDTNWNTLLSIEGLFQCAVCDRVITPDAVDAHISSVAHKINLDRCRPFSEYELSVIRKIDYYYHCGVCNLLTLELSSHIGTDIHKQNLTQAINSASSIAHKIVKNSNPLHETHCDIDKKDFKNTSNMGNASADVKNEPNLKLSTPSENDRTLGLHNNYNVGNKNHQRNNVTSLSNLSGQLGKSKRRIGNVKNLQKLPILECAKKTIKTSPEIAITDPKAFPKLRGPVNPLQISHENDKESADGKPIETSVGDISMSKLTGAGKNDPKTFSYALAAKKSVESDPEYVFHEYNTRLVKVKYDSWHMLICRKNKTFYCMACTESNITDKSAHCCCVTHIEKLQMCIIVDDYEDYFVRKMGDKFFHCGHCNNLQYPHDMARHIAKMHPPTTEKKIEPVKIEYTANVKNISTELKRSATPESVKSDRSDPVRTVEPVRTDSPDSVKSNSNSVNMLNSEIQTCPFDLVLSVDVLYYNAIIFRADQLFCTFCDSYVTNVVQHICGTQHMDILRKTPFLPSYNNNLIREVRDKFHCALCNSYIVRENIFTHIMNPPHTTLLDRASSKSQNRSPASPVSQFGPAIPQMWPSVPQIRPLAPQNLSPASQMHPPPSNSVLYTPAVRGPSVSTANMSTWWGSAPQLISPIVPMVPYRPPMIFSGPAINPSLYPQYRSPIMPVNNLVPPNVPTILTPKQVEESTTKVQMNESNTKSEDGTENADACATSNKETQECALTKTKKNKGSPTKKIKDIAKKIYTGVVKESKKTKMSPAKKPSMINEIKRNVDQLVPNENMSILNDGERYTFDVSTDFKDDVSRNSTTVKIVDNVRLRKSFSEVAAMLPKSESPVKPDLIETVTKLHLDKRKLTCQTRKNVCRETPAQSENTSEISDFARDAKLPYEVDKIESNEVNTTVERECNERKEDNTVNQMKNYTEDSNLLPEKSFGYSETEKKTVESTLADVKQVSELQEPVEQKVTSNETKKSSEVTNPDVDLKEHELTFTENRPCVEENRDEFKEASKSAVVTNESTVPNKSKKGPVLSKDETNNKKQINNDAFNDLALDVSDITAYSNKPYDFEEFIYLKLNDYIAKITLSSYNSLVPMGDGTRYCFVCWERAPKDLQLHVESSKHLDNMRGSKYMDHYKDNMIRWKNSAHHCSVCNVIVTCRVEKHISWQHHATKLLETIKSVRQLHKDTKKAKYRQFRAVTTKKIYTSTNPTAIKIITIKDNYF